ncbi:MAG: peptidase [Candidatus Solibacter sp.]|nr:peptidase [Candidatus Solibacter sp.]
MKRLLALCFTFFTVALAFAQETIDSTANARIRKEAAENSRLMHTLHMLTDRYGPRLTGSPNHEAAANWAVKQLTEWGFKNAHLEPWDFGHPGWMNEHAAGYLTSPVRDNLTFEVVAWTPSTKGVVHANAVEIAPPTTPTKEELTAYLAQNAEKVKGKVVLIGKATVVPVNFTPAALRRDDATIKGQFDPNNPNAGRGGFGGRGGRGAPPDPTKLTPAQMNEQIDAFLVANKALMRINDAAREHGQIRAFNNRTFDLAKAVPTVVLRNEDYGRIDRLLADGETVGLQFDILNQSFPKGTTAYNVVAELPGSDKAGEVVMLGGHLDSWHSATGATDNAIGCSMMMEAARVINALGLKPRRTIRVALWAGEEEGLLGSAAYVKQHFGTFENPKPEYAGLDAYFNIDSGTGRVRGAGVFGPPETATVLRAALAPFEDLGVAGALANTSRATGGTDSTNFSNAGLAGIGMQQDPIEYQSATWHTNLDTYERIVPEDAVKAVTVIAASVWHVANRNEMLPRFTKEKMPPLPPAPGTARPATTSSGAR